MSQSVKAPLFFLLQVHIEFTEGEDRITLEGPTKDLQMVQVEIEAMVLDLVSVAFFNWKSLKAFMSSVNHI